MGPNAPQVFSGISPENYAKLAAKAQAGGIDIAGPSGSASKFGVEVAWNYAEEKRELTLQCLSAPFFMSVADVHARLKKMVEESLA